MKIVFTIEFFKPLIEPVAAATGLKIVYMESLKFEKPGLAAMASIGMNAENLRSTCAADSGAEAGGCRGHHVYVGDVGAAEGGDADE